jgi:membrane protease YdiL (CAAX protease family)
VHARPIGRGRAVAFAASTAVFLGAWNNVVVPRLPGHPASYVPGNVAATALLLGAARADGIPWQDLGFDRGRLREGWRWGGLGSAAVAAGYAIGLTVLAVRPLLADARVAGADGGEVAYQVLIRIPLGTVLWEETAFRGVLLAALLRVLPPRTAVGISAAVFGLWHIRPTLDATAANDLASGLPGRTAAVLSGCVGTAAAGVLFTGLRMRSGSLLAPVLVHAAANCLGLLAAAAAHRLGPRAAGWPSRSRLALTVGGARTMLRECPVPEHEGPPGCGGPGSPGPR